MDYIYKCIVAKFVGDEKDKAFAKIGLVKNKKYLIKPIGVYLEKEKKYATAIVIMTKERPFTIYYENAYDIYCDWRILSKVDYDSPFCPLKRPRIKGTIFTYGKIKIKEAK